MRIRIRFLIQLFTLMRIRLPNWSGSGCGYGSTTLVLGMAHLRIPAPRQIPWGQNVHQSFGPGSRRPGRRWASACSRRRRPGPSACPSDPWGTPRRSSHSLPKRLEKWSHFISKKRIWLHCLKGLDHEINWIFTVCRSRQKHVRDRLLTFSDTVLLLQEKNILYFMQFVANPPTSLH